LSPKVHAPPPLNQLTQRPLQLLSAQEALGVDKEEIWDTIHELACALEDTVSTLSTRSALSMLLGALIAQRMLLGTRTTYAAGYARGDGEHTGGQDNRSARKP